MHHTADPEKPNRTNHRNEKHIISLVLGSEVPGLQLPYGDVMKNRVSKSGITGFTLLELIIVVLLISIILGLVPVYFSGMLSAGRFDRSVREISDTMKHARSLARISGSQKTITVDLDTREYGIDGNNKKIIPVEINIRIVEPPLGEISQGKYRFVFSAGGDIEGGKIILWNDKKSVEIMIDPVIGISLKR